MVRGDLVHTAAGAYRPAPNVLDPCGAPVKIDTRLIREKAASEMISMGCKYDPDFIRWAETLKASPALEQIARRTSDSCVWRPEGSPLDQLAAVLMSLHTMVAWETSGRPVFRPSGDLCALLMNTDVDEDQARLPFDGFEIQPPPGLIAFEGHDCTSILTKRITVDGEEYFGADLRLGPTSATVSAALQGGKVSGDLGDTSAPEVALIEQAKHLVRSLSSFIACRVEPLVAENQKAIDRDLEARKPARAKIFILGKTIKLSPMIRAVVSKRQSGDPLWKLKEPLQVRGHFRWQPIGHRLSAETEGPRNARKIWIHPYNKGPEGAERWQRVYEVTAEHEVTL